LSQLIDLYPIKAFIHNEKTGNINIIPEIDIMDFLKVYDLDKKYFTLDAINYRASKCSRDKNKFDKIKSDLELEFQYIQ
jgi:hypothetical protein